MKTLHKNENSMVSGEPSQVQAIISLFSEINSCEKHFNNLQLRYRMMASTWLLSTFAGIGFVLSGKIEVLKTYPPAVFITGISMASAIGLYLLWNLDLMVYHRLLDAWFIEGYFLEKKHSFLPQVRSTMWIFCGKGILNRVLLFYLISVGTVLAIGLLALYLYVCPMLSTTTKIFFLLCSIGSVCLILGGMWRSTSNTASLLKKVEESRH